jgi:hypothetical protein
LFVKSNNNELDLSVFVNVARSFNDIASETILTDVTMVIIGFSIVFTYVIFMLGRFSWIENRVIIILTWDTMNMFFVGYLYYFLRPFCR